MNGDDHDTIPPARPSKKVPPDNVNHPSHYTTGKIEVADFIADQRMGFFRGNVTKYVARSPHKGRPLEDLKKARWYLDYLIRAMEEGNADID